MDMGNQFDWRPGRVIVATLVTALVPGTGHLLLKRWRSAAVWGAAFTLTLLIGWQLLNIDSLGHLFDPYAIRRGLLLSGFLALVRLGAIVDVLWLTGSFRSAVPSLFGSLVVLIALIPHVWIQVAGQQTVHALETVFAPTTTTVLASSERAVPTTLVQNPDDLGVYGSMVTSTTIQGELALPTTRPLAPSESIRFYDQRSQLALGADERFTVLLLGSDEGPGRGGIRTDAMIVASIDPWTLQTSMFSVPRNWAQMPMPTEWPGPDTHDSLSNTIYRYGWTNAAELFPDASDPGAEVLKRVLGDLLQLEIDQYWKVSMAGFVDVVDAVGGVKVNVQLPIDNEYSHPEISGEWYYVKLNTGLQHLDGLEALAYSRSRRTTSDYHRMGRQRCVVAALAQQVTPGDLLFGFDELIGAFEDHVSTDISLSILPALVDVSTLIQLDDITTVTFVPPTFVDGVDSQGRWVPHVELVRQAVVDSLAGSGEQELIEFAVDAC